MGNMGNMLKQAQKAMEQIQKLETEMANTTVEGSAASGKVKVEVTGSFQVVSFHIDPEVVDPNDVEMLEDLALTAVKDALEKVQKLKADRTQEITGGLGLPPNLMGL